MLNLIRRLKEEQGIAVVLISHRILDVIAALRPGWRCCAAWPKASITRPCWVADPRPRKYDRTDTGALQSGLRSLPK